MDQDLSAEAIGLSGHRTLRWILLFFGTLGLALALSVLLGGSPAHADDGAGSGENVGLTAGVLDSATSVVGSATGQLSSVVTGVTGVAHDVTSPVTDPVTAAVAATVAGVVTNPIVEPVVAPILEVLPEITGPVVAEVLTPLTTIGALLEASTASAVVATAEVITTLPPIEAPDGLSSFPVNGTPIGGGSISAGASPAPLLAGMLAIPLFLLLAHARARTRDDAIPGSPVFDTDSSPD